MKRENIFGLSCIDLRQFEQAEESFNTAIDSLNKKNEKTLLLRVRNNIGLMYANQNFSSLAIRHLSEITENMPNHFKALYLQAEENHLKSSKYFYMSNEARKKLLAKGALK